MALFRRRMKRDGTDLVAKKGKGGMALPSTGVSPGVVGDDGREALSGREVLGFEDPILGKDEFEVPVFEDDPKP